MFVYILLLLLTIFNIVYPQRIYFLPISAISYVGDECKDERSHLYKVYVVLMDILATLSLVFTMHWFDTGPWDGVSKSGSLEGGGGGG